MSRENEIRSMRESMTPTPAYVTSTSFPLGGLLLWRMYLNMNPTIPILTTDDFYEE
jgi:hypothetical protein